MYPSIYELKINMMMVKSASNSKGTPKIYLKHLEMFLKIKKIDMN